MKAFSSHLEPAVTITASTPSAARPNCLDAGQCLLMPVRAGAVIQVVRGRLHLTEPPRWLAETLSWPTLALAEGQAHCVGQAGWLALRAGDGEAAHWLQSDPVPAWATAWHRLLYFGRAGIFARSAARRARLSGGHISDAL